MPTVPTTTGPGVRTAQMPGIRAPAETFGGGGAARAPTLEPLAQTALDIYQHEKQKADDIAVLDSASQLAGGETDLLHNPQSGVLNLRGKDASGAIDAARDGYGKLVNGIAGGLSNDAQKLAFQRMAQARWDAIDEQVQTHMAAERQVYDHQTYTAFVGNESSAAVASGLRDPQRVEEAVAHIRAATTDYGTRNGWSPEQVTQASNLAVSQTRMGVLERMLANEQDLAASRYVADHRDEFVSKDLEQAERLTEAGSVRAESQRLTDDITTKATDLSAALEQVRTLQDPRIRDAAEQRVRRFYADKAADDRQQRAVNFQQAGEILEQQHDVDKIPRGTWLSLSVEEREALQRREDQIRHPKVITNQSVYASLVNMAGLNDATKQQFLALPLATDATYRAQLSDEDFKHLLNLQRELRSTDTRRAVSAETSQHRREEAAVIKKGEQAQKAQTARTTAEQLSPGASKYLPPTPKVTVPKWMVDSAAADAEYADYLKLHGVVVPKTTTSPIAPSDPGGNIDLRKPTAPGAPIVRAPVGLTPAGSPNEDEQ